MNCPVCNSPHLDSLVNLGQMPLSVLGLESDPKKSIEGKVHPIDIFTCRNCSHVFNNAYDSTFAQPFVGGCTMYNSGGPWSIHMERIARYVDCAADGGKVIEIGAGNGEFAKMCNTKDYVAYEPTDDAQECKRSVTTYQEYFRPEFNMKGDAPDVIVMRHVLEHYAKPGEFLQELSDNSRRHKLNPYLIIEVPNVQNALRDLRIEDWVYEHPQHFTPNSMHTLARMHGWAVDDMFTSYNDEVLIARLLPFGGELGKGRSYMFDGLLRVIQQVRAELMAMDTLRPDSVVLWGGAGKGATLINLLNLDLTVVDSDKRKWGKYVPGTDLMIVEPAVLKLLKPDLVVVTTSWRVKDIVEEIILNDYPVGRVANFCRGKLTTYQG